MSHEKQIPAHDQHHAPDSQENACSSLFASKIKAHIFSTSAHHHACTKAVRVKATSPL